VGHRKSNSSLRTCPYAHATIIKLAPLQRYLEEGGGDANAEVGGGPPQSKRFVNLNNVKKNSSKILLPNGPLFFFYSFHIDLCFMLNDFSLVFF
jgi:hypothetical protein